jgi:hypothetical protein
MTSIQTITSICCACKQWQKVGMSLDLRALCPNLKILGKDIWEKCLQSSNVDLELSDSQFNKRLVISSLREFYTHVKEGTPVTLMMMPKGLNAEKLTEILSVNRISINFPNYEGTDNYFFTCSTVEKTYWVVISSEIFISYIKCGLQNLSFEELQKKDLDLVENDEIIKNNLGKGWGVAEFLPSFALQTIKLINALDDPASLIPETVLTQNFREFSPGNCYLYPTISFNHDHIQIYMSDEVFSSDVGILAQNTLKIAH